MADKKEKIQSIDCAAYQIKQELYGARHLGARLIATVHKTDNGSAGNVWYVPTAGKAWKIIPERELSGVDPNTSMLVGEALRMTFEKEEIKNGDLGVSEGVVGLYLSARALGASKKS